MIEVRQLSKSYGAFEALKSVSFTLNKGEVVGFLGPNGAGKTTTMRIITGFLPPSSGTCVIDGLDVEKDSLETRRKIGYLPESNALYLDMEVSEYLTYVGKLRELGSKLPERLKAVTQTCGLEKAIGKKISALSKGYRQRVGLAQALIHDPEILILDEPTVGLDPNQIVEIRNLIRTIGETKTILLSSHILSEVSETCGRVIIISDGKISGQGTPEELIAQTEGAEIFKVQIKGLLKDIDENLKKIPGVKDCKLIDPSWFDTGLQWTEAQLTFDKKQGESNGGAEIFKMAVDRKWTLRELHRENMTLEDVFKKLTR